MRPTYRTCLITATALSGAMWSNQAWADCVSLAPVHPEQVVCDAPGTLGWDGSGTNDIVVTINNGATVSTSPGGAALISTGTGSAVINFAGDFSGGVPTYGINAGSSTNMAIAVGGNSVVTNSSGAAILGSIDFGNASGTAVNVLNNNYSSTGGTNHIGLIDGDVTAAGNFTLNNAGLMGWYADVNVTQTGSGTVNISNGVDDGYVTGFTGAYSYQNGFIWGDGTVIATDGSTTLVNHGGGNGMGSLINGDIILGQLGEGTSTLTNGSTTYGNATIMGDVTMADHNNTITNDGTITGDVLMDGMGTNTYNAGSTGSSGDNGYRMVGVATDANGLATGVGTGTLTGHSGANNILNLNGIGSSHLTASVVNFYTINKNDSGYWTIGAQLAADDNQTINLNSGVLQVDDADYLNTSVLTTIHNNSNGYGFGALIFSGSGAGTFSGNIDGTGTVGITGANPTTWTGTNTYSGWTYIYSGGVLNANSTGALSASSDMYLANGTLNVNANSVVNNLIDYLSVNSVVNINGANSLSVAGGHFGDYGGLIQGTGTLIKYSTGTLDLYGANLMNAANLTVNDGIVNDHGGSIGDNTAVAVNSTGTTTGVLNILANDTIGSLAGTGSNAQVNLSSGATLTTGGLNTSTTFAGMIAGDGALVKTGTGAMTLTGFNTYAGGTTINGGSIIGYAGTNASNGSLQGDILVALGASVGFDQSLSPNGNGSGTYSGQLSGGGFATFLGNGSAVLTLTGDNSGLTGGMNFYNNSIVAISAANNVSSGPLNFANGTLENTADVTLGNSIFLGTGGGTFLTDNGTTMQLNGGISGTGGLTKTGAGRLILNGSNSYTGGTLISAGVLQANVSNGSLTGDVVNDAQLDLTAASCGVNCTFVYSGSISGTGNVQIINNSSVGLMGANSYTGTTTVTAGSRLIALSGSALAPQSTFIVDGLLEISGGNQAIGGLSGSGLVATGGATLSIGANNTSTTFSGVIGAGDVWAPFSTNVNKIGTGTLTLSGTGSVLTGNLGVQAGKLSLTGDLTAATTSVDSGAILSVDGALTSPTVLVNLGGRLIGGVGTTPGVITGDVTNNGTVAPGHSPGIISIVGSYTQGSTGTYIAEVGANGTNSVMAGVDYDRIAVSGTTGAAALDGTLQVVQNGGLYVAGTNYDVITTTGGITGNFASISGNVISPFITLSNLAANGGGVVGNNYRLVVVRSAYNTVALNPNQAAVANGLQALVGATGTSATVVKIDNMTAPQAQALFASTSPEPYGAYVTALQDQGELFTRQVAGRMASSGDTTNGLWVTGYGHWGNGKDRDYRFGSDQRIIGVSGGFDFGLSGLRAGLAAGYSEDKVTYLQGNSAGKSKSWQVGGYAAYATGPIHVDAQVAYVSGDINATKLVNAGAGLTLISGTSGATTKGHLFKGAATVGYDLGTDHMKFRPYVGIDFTSGKIDGFTESGMGVLNLTVADIDADRTDLVAGVQLSMPAGTITPYLNAAYRYRLNDSVRSVTAYFDGLSGSPFTVTEINSARSQIDVDAGLSAKVGSGASVFVGYQGTFRNDINSHGVNGGVRLSF